MSMFIAIIFIIIMVEEFKLSAIADKQYLLITHMGAGNRPKK